MTTEEREYALNLVKQDLPPAEVAAILSESTGKRVKRKDVCNLKRDQQIRSQLGTKPCCSLVFSEIEAYAACLICGDLERDGEVGVVMEIDVFLECLFSCDKKLGVLTL